MADIREWRVEDPQFWETTGKGIANRNLWISIPSLLCGFAVWIYWSIITVQMLNAGFPFKPAELFTLAAIAGLTGATLRIPSSFFIRIAGGRNTIVFTTALLMIPALGTGIALQSKETPLWVFQLLAFLSGFGGGNFASSMSNISFFFPKRMQGLALGLNAGLGNAGVTTMQILVPLVMTIPLLGSFGGDPVVLEQASGSLVGKIAAGTPTYIQNAGFVWLFLLVPLAFIGWFGMNNIHTEEVSPHIGSPLGAISKITGMLLIGFITAGVGLYLILPAPAGLGLPSWTKWVVLPGVIALTVFLLKLIPGEIKPNLQRQFLIFGNKHTWVMSVIYTMTFGSFIGYSAAFALAIKVIFGFSHIAGVDGVLTHTTVNPNAPSALMYAWMGPFIGALIRPIGGWISDKVGGALVTQIITVVMIAAALGVRLLHERGLSIGHAGTVFHAVLPAVPGPVRGQWHRQRLHLPHHRHGVSQGTGRAGARLDLGGGGLWRFHHPAGIWRADQGHHARVRALRFRHFLLHLSAAELVVLPRPQGGVQESLSGPVPTVRLSI